MTACGDVLVVDDDVDMLEVIELVLQEAGYTTRTALNGQQALDAVAHGMPALIAIRKSPAWWAMTQDERRAVFEQRSRHIADSLPFLPRIARRLYHARELGQPFDFVTWFEFAPDDASAFDDLVAMLRSREEWRYVDREVDIRLSR